jgi:hypothetical protein
MLERFTDDPAAAGVVSARTSHYQNEADLKQRGRGGYRAGGGEKRVAPAEGDDDAAGDNTAAGVGEPPIEQQEQALGANIAVATRLAITWATKQPT